MPVYEMTIHRDETTPVVDFQAIQKVLEAEFAEALTDQPPPKLEQWPASKENHVNPFGGGESSESQILRFLPNFTVTFEVGDIAWVGTYWKFLVEIDDPASFERAMRVMKPYIP